MCLQLLLPVLVKRSPRVKNDNLCTLLITLPFHRKMAVTFPSWQQQNPPSDLAGSDLEVSNASQGWGNVCTWWAWLFAAFLAFYFHQERKSSLREQSRSDYKIQCVETSNRNSIHCRKKVHIEDARGSGLKAWDLEFPNLGSTLAHFQTVTLRLCFLTCGMCIKIIPALYHWCEEQMS